MLLLYNYIATENDSIYMYLQDGTLSTNYSDRYDDTSAVWVMMCAILMFFMVSSYVAQYS